LISNKSPAALNDERDPFELLGAIAKKQILDKVE
jgi:hypothetical protein